MNDGTAWLKIQAELGLDGIYENTVVNQFDLEGEGRGQRTCVHLKGSGHKPMYMIKNSAIYDIVLNK